MVRLFCGGSEYPRISSHLGSATHGRGFAANFIPRLEAALFSRRKADSAANTTRIILKDVFMVSLLTDFLFTPEDLGRGRASDRNFLSDPEKWTLLPLIAPSIPACANAKSPQRFRTCGD